VQDADIQLLEQGTIHFQMELWNQSKNLMGEIYISRLELKRWSLEFVMVKYIFGILEEGLAKSLWDHIIQIMLRAINFKDTFSQLRKVKKKFETVTP
jgi:hypothetical protein